MGPGGDDKRRKIIDAAVVLFGRYGFRRTSVDQIAAEAGVAKGTLYASFAGKDDVFRGACELVAETYLAGAEAARAADTLAGRLRGALEAKFTYIFELVHRSPHAGELLASQGELGADVIARADAAYIAIVEAMVADAAASGELDPGRIGLDAAGAASLLFRLAHGAGTGASDADEHRRDLGELVRLFLSGLR